MNLLKQKTGPRAAFTVAEVVVTMGLGAFVLAGLAMVSLYMARSFVGMGNYADLDRASRNALDNMTREIRQANYLVSSTANTLVFNVAGGTNLTYSYNASAGTLVRSKTGEPNTTLLQQCDYLQFNTYQRNMSNQVFGAFSNASPATCKLIDMSWRCSRKILQQKVNTESVQTAKIVIRNEHPH